MEFAANLQTKPMTASHPTTEQLRAFALGQLDPSESSFIERHVETCVDCCLVLNEVPDDDVLKMLKQGDALRNSEAAGVSPGDDEMARGQIPLALQQHARYRVIKVLGDGGMGVVYQAEHRLMARMVALKVINRRLLSNPLAVERFRREFKAAARLTHPNIVVAHDAEEAGGLHFLVMEFVDGVSLAQYVERRGPLPVATACFFIRQAALGLQHADRRGMVHRDIKPQNLMLTRKGQIKILDFGLARFASEEAALSGLQPTFDGLDAGIALTQAGTIVGTPDYMAPEQGVDSSQADIRSDIYSLGCTFFFLLTGQPPFSGNSIAGAIHSHAALQPPELNTLRNDVPPELVRIIQLMMAKDTAKRIQTPGEVANLLTKLATGGLAAASTSDIAAAISATPAPAITVLDGSPQREGPASTLQLLVQGRWQPPCRRIAHLLWQRLQRRPYQIAGALGVALCMCLGALGIANRSQPDEVKPADVIPHNPVVTIERPAVVAPPLEIPVKKQRARVALVLTRQSFWSPDYVYLKDSLEREGTEVTVVSSRVGPVTSEPTVQPDQEILEVQAEIAFGEIRPGDFDAVVFIPSSNTEFIHDPAATPAENQASQNNYSRVVRELVEADVCLAALGNAVNLLARYRILDGHEATGPDWVAEQADYVSVKWDTTQSVVASGPNGQFVTALNIRSIREFAEKVQASSTTRSQARR